MEVEFRYELPRKIHDEARIGIEGRSSKVRETGRGFVIEAGQRVEVVVGYSPV